MLAFAVSPVHSEEFDPINACNFLTMYMKPACPFLLHKL